jgi:signal transduction histidine kinase
MTRLVSEQLAAELLEIYSSQLGALVVSPDFPETDPLAQQAFLRQALGRLQAFDGGVVILNADGIVSAADPGRPDMVGQDWSRYAFVQQMIASPKVMLSNILPEGLMGEAAVALAVPRQNRQGAVVGLFHLSPQSENNGLHGSMIRLLGRFIRAGQNAYLVDGNGRVIYHTLSSRVGEDWTGEVVVQRVLVGETASIHTNDFDGHEIIASFSPINPPASQASARFYNEANKPAGQLKLAPVTDRTGKMKTVYAPRYGTVETTWGLVVEESWAELTKTSQRYERWLLLLLGLGALVPVAVISVGARRITGPIERLSAAAREVAGGEFDQVIEVNTRDEFEELAEQFNHMSAELQVSYTNLEQRVADRTQEVEQRMQELDALYRADERMHRYLQLDQVLQALVDVSVDMLHADKSSVFMWANDPSAGGAEPASPKVGKRLVMRIARGYTPEAMSTLSFARGEGAVGYVVATGKPIIVEDTATDPRRENERIEVLNAIDSEGIRSFMYLPIKIGGEVFGVFNVSFTSSLDCCQDDERVFPTLVNRAALAIENARLYGKAQQVAVVEERNRLARDLHDAVTQTLFSASLIAEVLPRIWERKPDEGRRRLDELRELTRGALAEMRTLLLELRPAALIEARLSVLLRQLAESITGRARVPVTVTVDGECDPPPPSFWPVRPAN